MAVLVGAVCIAACGDPLVGGEFLGTPQKTFTGTFTGEITGSGKPISPHMGVVWFKVITEAGETRHERLTEVTPIASSEFPWSFTFHVYAHPPEEALNLFIDPGATTGATAALGRSDILVFDDVDQDGSFSFMDNAPRRLRPPDRIIGFAVDHVLLWFARDASDLEGPVVGVLPVNNPDAFTEGYSVMRLNCGQPVALITDPVPTITVDLLEPTDRIPSRTGTPECPGSIARFPLP